MLTGVVRIDQAARPAIVERRTEAARFTRKERNEEKKKKKIGENRWEKKLR